MKLFAFIFAVITVAVGQSEDYVSYLEKLTFPSVMPADTGLFREKKSFASAPNYPNLMPAASTYVAPAIIQPDSFDFDKSYEVQELVRLRKHALVDSMDYDTAYNPQMEPFEIDYETSASTYSAPSYVAPSYSAPAPAMNPGYATTHTYQSYAPTVPCAKNVLVSCAPSVAPVPCAAPGYSKPYSKPEPCPCSGLSGNYVGSPKI